jgi:nucleoside-diphosphate-sugar epimerase
VRVLVTGGAGFIGSHYVRTALTGGLPDLAEAEVVVLDKLTSVGDLDNLAAVSAEPVPRPALLPRHRQDREPAGVRAERSLRGGARPYGAVVPGQPGLVVTRRRQTGLIR